MSDTTFFLAAEFTEIGLAAAADPQIAERLLEALRCLPPAAGEADSRAVHPE